MVPLLQIVSSKSNEERLLLVTPELASVPAAMVCRIRGDDGRVPLSARYDPLRDLRRMFVMDAVTGGLPVRIAAKILDPSLNTTQAYLAVFQEELIKSYQAFLDTRRADRPAAEYREPTEQEWDEF
ncbi:hypothetical protein ACF08N_35505 [Streptomyces sp. NPDC015127]|uniref:hypothetical protein n=1 Tax=Streptomyces sp. NPDC015127 TaxID=3364939 RepID=UPI0036F7C979